LGIIDEGKPLALTADNYMEQLMNDKKIELTLGLVNAVMQYLGTRPYAEVADMIQAIREQAIPQVPMPEEAKPAEQPLIQ
jgi:hypothetical protein